MVALGIIAGAGGGGMPSRFFPVPLKSWTPWERSLRFKYSQAAPVAAPLLRATVFWVVILGNLKAELLARYVDSQDSHGVSDKLDHNVFSRALDERFPNVKTRKRVTNFGRIPVAKGIEIPRSGNRKALRSSQPSGSSSKVAILSARMD